MFRRRRRANNNQQTPPPSSGNSSSSATAPSSNIPIATPIVAPPNIPVATPVYNVQSSRIRQPTQSAQQRPRYPTLICHTCRQPIRNERHIHTSRSRDRRYHHQCFICLHCNAPIDPKNDSFCYAKVNKSSGSVNSVNSVNNGSERADGKDVNEEHPFHRECFAQHFGWMCVVCEKPLPMVVKYSNDNNATTTSSSNGSSDNGESSNNNNNNSVAAAAGSGQQTTGRSTKVEFLKHPFFDKERMCPHHATPAITRTTIEQQNNPLQQTIDENTTTAESNNGDGSIRNTTTSEEVLGEIRRCAGCHRFEPLFASPTKHFIDVGDGNTGRCVCLACCRTVVTTSDDVQPLWDKVIDFFEGPLGLITSEATLHNQPFAGVTRRDLKNIPIMVVGMEALNDNTRTSGSSHFGSHQIMTRGLCLSEHHASSSREKGCGSVGVTAILILSGLPSDLTASILAHEATHAWIKLHPNFPYTDPLPLRVEEGLCQLVAFLFLNDGLDPINNDDVHTSSLHSSTTTSEDNEGSSANAKKDEDDDSTIPSDEKLRQYFRFCIETDEGEYGVGFRLAARAYAKMGIQELLYYVALNHDFPPLS